MWGLAARQGNITSERLHREELLSGMLRSPNPFGTAARRLRGRGWGNFYGVITARQLRNRNMIGESPLCNSGGSPCRRYLVGGVCHHDVVAKTTPLPKHFHDCSVFVCRSPGKRCSTAVVRRAWGHTTRAQQHFHNATMPTSCRPRERCPATIVWFIGADVIPSE